MTPQERAEKHFDGYVGPMQRTMLDLMMDVCMEMSRFHYVTSHVHGAKHQEQDARETARAAFTPVQENCQICKHTACGNAGGDGRTLPCPSFTTGATP